jgi:hypothetical protein
MPQPTVNRLMLKNILIGLAETSRTHSEILAVLTSEVVALREAVYEPGSAFDERQKEVGAIGDTLKAALEKLQKMLRELPDLIQ